jgi:hypothetical protein
VSGQRSEEVETAALMVLVGMDPSRYLRTRDPLEQLMLVAVCDRAIELRELEREILAQEIANRVGEMLGG